MVSPITKMWANFSSGARHVVRSPSFLIPVILALAFNGAASDALPGAATFLTIAKHGTASEIVAVAIATGTSTFFAIYGLLTVSATILSIYSVRVGYSLFARGTSELILNLKRVGPIVVAVFLAIHLLITAVVIVLAFSIFAATISTVSVGPGVRTVLMVALFGIMFPLYYMALSCSIVLVCSDGTFRERFIRFRLFLTYNAIGRLVTFYITRIGIEAACAVGLGIALANFGISPGVALIITAVGLGVPFALVRSAGFALKLDLLEADPWFRSTFGRYYASLHQ